MKTMQAKFAGRCGVCGGAFPKGETIAYNGRAHHPACVDNERAEQARKDEAEFERLDEGMKDFKAGKWIKCDIVKNEIIVTGAPNYAMARAEAQGWICNIRAAGGRAHLVVKTKGGKRYVGRTIVRYYEGSNLGHHEGWAFRYYAEVA